MVGATAEWATFSAVSRAARPGGENGWSKVQTLNQMAWYAGAASIFSGGSCGCSMYLCTSARWQAVAQTALPAVVGAPAAPANRFRGAGGFQGGFADLMTTVRHPKRPTLGPKPHAIAANAFPFLSATPSNGFQGRGKPPMSAFVHP